MLHRWRNCEPIMRPTGFHEGSSHGKARADSWGSLLFALCAAPEYTASYDKRKPFAVVLGRIPKTTNGRSRYERATPGPVAVNSSESRLLLAHHPSSVTLRSAFCWYKCLNRAYGAGVAEGLCTIGVWLSTSIFYHYIYTT